MRAVGQKAPRDDRPCPFCGEAVSGSQAITEEVANEPSAVTLTVNNQDAAHGWTLVIIGTEIRRACVFCVLQALKRKHLGEAPDLHVFDARCVRCDGRFEEHAHRSWVETVNDPAYGPVSCWNGETTCADGHKAGPWRDVNHEQRVLAEQAAREQQVIQEAA